MHVAVVQEFLFKETKTKTFAARIMARIMALVTQRDLSVVYISC